MFSCVILENVITPLKNGHAFLRAMKEQFVRQVVDTPIPVAVQTMGNMTFAIHIVSSLQSSRIFCSKQ